MGRHEQFCSCHKILFTEEEKEEEEEERSGCRSYSPWGCKARRRSAQATAPTAHGAAEIAVGALRLPREEEEDRSNSL